MCIRYAIKENNGREEMETQQAELFQLTENNIDQVRYIKLDKKVGNEQKKLEEVLVSQNMKAEIVQFYSLGFYDSLTCVKTQMRISQAHKKHFMITCPYQRTAETLKVEQWFGILPLSTGGRYQAGVGNTVNEDMEPFFCRQDLQEKLPFVGVVLISLKNTSRTFKPFLADYILEIERVFHALKEKRKGICYLAQIYYSLNCVDLCLVIRTDALPFIHEVNYELNGRVLEEGSQINTTVIFAVQGMDGLKERLKKIKTKNKEVSFVVRSYQKCPDFNRKSSGVNGVGKYVTIFSYDEYLQYLPKLTYSKLNGMENDTVFVDSFVKSICHEREWFQENDYTAYEPDKNTIEKEKNERLAKATCQWVEDIYNKIVAVEQIAEKLFLFEKEIYKYKEMFICEFRLVKDLVNTYADLWYQNVSESGFVFFCQLWTALQGIETMLQKIKEEKESGDRLERLEKSLNGLLGIMHEVVCDLNGYNKQFQLLNQDSVNLPVYEIQSKVNAEKYMAAYCAFLHKFFVLYYNGKEHDEYIVQDLPLALVDLNQKRINTTFYFSRLYVDQTKQENIFRRGMFTVHFPSSEYFSNVWSSIPLLMHEASHAHHYGKVEDRNHALLYNINQYFADKLSKILLSIVNEGVLVNTSDFLINILKKSIYQVVEDIQKKYLIQSNEFKYLRFQMLRQKCSDFYDSIFDQSDDKKNMRYSQLVNLRNKVKEDVNFLVKKFKFEKICYVFTKYVDYPPAMYYFLNVLYLEFHSDFYKRYQKEYDEGFLENLKKEAEKEREDQVEKMMLLLAWYRFTVIIKQEEKSAVEEIAKQLPFSIKETLYSSFSVVLVAGIWIIFEKYRKNFSSVLSEQTYYKKLLPHLDIDDILKYTEKLSGAYEVFVKENSGSQKLEYDKNLMEHMLYEYYEIYIAVNNITSFLFNEELSMCVDRSEIRDAFIKNVHDALRKVIEKEEKKDQFHAIFAKSNREKLVKLGFFEKDSTILRDVFSKVVLEGGTTFVEDMFVDRVWLFQEVYADCGMCYAMGFDPFGYCIFASSIYNITNDPYELRNDRSFLADRLCAVMRMYFDEDESGKWPELYETFLQKIFDVNMVTAICKMLLRVSENKIVQDVYDYAVKYRTSIYKREGFVKTIRDGMDQKKFSSEKWLKIISEKQTPEKLDFMIWRDEVVGALIGVIEEQYTSQYVDEQVYDRIYAAKEYLFRVYSVVDLLIEEDILSNLSDDFYDGFFQKVKKYMEADAGMRAVQAEPCVKEICRFYNMDCPEDVGDKFDWYYSVYSNRFLSECNFIFDYYCEHRNAYGHLSEYVKTKWSENEPISLEKWYDIVDSYYLNGVT